jgi:hypothetical protein
VETIGYILHQIRKMQTGRSDYEKEKESSFQAVRVRGRYICNICNNQRPDGSHSFGGSGDASHYGTITLWGVVKLVQGRPENQFGTTLRTSKSLCEADLSCLLLQTY